MTINLEWDPTNETQEGLVSLIAVLVDLCGKFNTLNTLADDE